MFSIMKILNKILPGFTINYFKHLRINFLRFFRKDIDFFYDDDFARSPLRDKKWTTTFCDIIMEKFNPRSIIDFGCGTGDILAPFEKKGIDIFGLDGSKANRKNLKIKKENFLLFDLRNKYNCSKKYDLCFCLEVAEHINENYVSILIDNLTHASSTIVFTSAPPGQKGIDHINLQPYSWWIFKFNKSNFKVEEELTNCLKEKMTSAHCIDERYINNLLVFKSIN